MRHFRDRLEAKGKVTRARELRALSTPTERAVWETLRRKNLFGLKFRRQHPMHGFIVDFYCPALRLVIELDGEVHASDDRLQYDRARDQILSDLGYRVIRLSNKDATEPVLRDLLRPFVDPTRELQG